MTQQPSARGSIDTAKGHRSPRKKPPTSPSFYREFTSGDHATRAVLADLVETLSGNGVLPDTLWTLELILAEALNNVTEHAYEEGGGPVELEVMQRVDGLECRISDHGKPMPSDDAPNPPLPVIEPPDSLPEGGFGWHIIRSLTTDLTYRRSNGRNILTMLVPATGAEIDA